MVVGLLVSPCIGYNAPLARAPAPQMKFSFDSVNQLEAATIAKDQLDTPWTSNEICDQAGLREVCARRRDSNRLFGRSVVMTR